MSYRVKNKASLLGVRLTPKNAELALALLFQSGISTLQEKRKGKYLEFLCRIPAKVEPQSLKRRLHIEEKATSQKKIFLEIKIIMVPQKSWIKEYQKKLKPFYFPQARMKKPFHPLLIDPRGQTPKKGDKNTLYLTPGLAFGTGSHPSTQLAGVLLLKSLWEHGGAEVLDVGCGTGILAMLAKKREARGVTAVDMDPEALRVARQNLRNNRIKAVSFKRSLQSVKKKHDIVVANILLQTLRELYPLISTRVKTGGNLILSGLLYRDCPQILKTYKNFRLVEQIHKKGWSALLFKKVTAP